MDRWTALLVGGFVMIVLGVFILAFVWSGPSLSTELEIDVGSRISYELITHKPSKIYSVVDRILDIYEFDKHEKVYIRLDWLPNSISPEEYVRGLIYFRAPYNMSLSFDNKTYKPVTLGFLVFVPRNVSQIERELSQYNGIEFSSKKYLFVGLFEWRITFMNGTQKIILEYQYKSEGYLDGLNITVIEGANVENIMFAWAGDLDIKERYSDQIEFDSDLVTAIMSILSGAVFVGVGARGKLNKPFEPRMIPRILERMDSRGVIYVRAWNLLLLFSILVLFLILYDVVIRGQDILIVLFIVVLLLDAVGLLLIFNFATGLIQLQRSPPFRGFIPKATIVLPIVFGVGFIGGLIITSTVENSVLGLGITYLILVVVAILLVKLRLAEKDVEALKSLVIQLSKKYGWPLNEELSQS